VIELVEFTGWFIYALIFLVGFVLGTLFGIGITIYKLIEGV